ncbi:MAG: diaminopimelate decarboxylase [Clostridia bacterium]|nr:diaminopimelate decarboxylase [Clostridia bacterium]
MKKIPFVTLTDVEKIVETIPTPFHLYDEHGIRENARRLKAAFAWNRGYREYFAVKATPNPYLLQILREEGCGADCSSYTELMLANSVGFSGADIMFSSNVTPAQDFKLASDLGAYINFDDLKHVDFAAKLFPFPKTMCLRFNPGGFYAVGNGIMDNPGDAKYGMGEEDIIAAAKKLMEYGVKNLGLHAFLVSNAVTDQYYPQLATTLFELAVRVRKATGIHISFVNLSGGIGIPYRPEEDPCSIEKIGEGVRAAYERILTPEGMDDVAIFTELGRYMLAPYGALVAKVLHQKDIYKTYLGLDACAADLMRPAMYGAYHHITVLGKENEACDTLYDVTGGLCENNDKFAIDRLLPKAEIGDYVYIHDTGAHGHSMGYNYNGKLRSAEVLWQEDGTPKLIRRAERPEDYFSTLDFSPFYQKMFPTDNER